MPWLMPWTPTACCPGQKQRHWTGVGGWGAHHVKSEAAVGDHADTPLLPLTT